MESVNFVLAKHTATHVFEYLIDEYIYAAVLDSGVNDEEN